MRRFFLTVLILGIGAVHLAVSATALPSAIAPGMPDPITGTWVLRATQCLAPMGPRYPRPDANARWSFADGEYEIHFDASDEGRYPQCHDLAERGLYRINGRDTKILRIEFAATASTSCKRPMNGPGGEREMDLKESADRPNQTFELENDATGKQLYQDYDSDEACKRMRFIYGEAPSV